MTYVQGNLSIIDVGIYNEGFELSSCHLANLAVMKLSLSVVDSS